MTTQSWAFAADHQTDAGFRAWGSDFSAHLAAVGLVQTADTGQINWTTVTRPGTNTDAGFETWHWNDSLEGTAPIFMRFNYGTGATATRPRIQMIIGTGSNGSGTITGTALTGTLATSAAAGTATGSSFTSYMCHTGGVFWFVWQAGGANTGLARSCVWIARTFDSDGNPTATGALIVWSNGSGAVNTQGNWKSLRFAATAAAYADTPFSTSPACSVTTPQGVTTTLTGGAPQAWLFWTWTPQVTPVLMCVTAQAEIAEAATFNAILIGTANRTFISMGREGSQLWVADSSGTGITGGICAIWE